MIVKQSQLLEDRVRYIDSRVTFGTTTFAWLECLEGNHELAFNGADPGTNAPNDVVQVPTSNADLKVKFYMTPIYYNGSQVDTHFKIEVTVGSNTFNREWFQNNHPGGTYGSTVLLEKDVKFAMSQNTSGTFDVPLMLSSARILYLHYDYTTGSMYVRSQGTSHPQNVYETAFSNDLVYSKQAITGYFTSLVVPSATDGEAIRASVQSIISKGVLGVCIR